MQSFRPFTYSIRICRRLLQTNTRCLCTSPEGGSTRKHEDRTKLEGDKYDETPELEAQNAEQRHREQEEQETEITKKRILGAALRYVPQHGWSKQAIIAGTESAGFPPMTHGLISNGPIELVYHFYDLANQDLANKLAKEVEEVENGIRQKKGTTDFIREALIYRLQRQVPYINTWPQALGLMALPQNTTSSLKHLYHLVDDMWYHAGDRSTDVNYYTKRGTLALVYQAISLHLLQDQSTDYKDTWVFLDRRLQNLASVGKNMKQVQDLTGSVGDIFLGSCIMARNMLGLTTKQR